MEERKAQRDQDKKGSISFATAGVTHELLRKVVNTYNRTPHNTIGVSPNEAYASGMDPESATVKAMKAAIVKNSKGREYAGAPKFEKGDLVRVGLRKPSAAFAKGDDPQYTRQLYRVVQVNQHGPSAKSSDDAKTHVLTYRVEELRPEHLIAGTQYYKPSNKELKRDSNIKAMYRDIPNTAFRESSLVWANQVEDQFGDKLTDIFTKKAYDDGIVPDPK